MPRFLAVFVGPLSGFASRPISVTLEASDLRSARVRVEGYSCAWILDGIHNELGLPASRASALASLQDALDEKGWVLAEMARDDHDWSIYRPDRVELAMDEIAGVSR